MFINIIKSLYAISIFDPYCIANLNAANKDLYFDSLFGMAKLKHNMYVAYSLLVIVSINLPLDPSLVNDMSLCIVH